MNFTTDLPKKDPIVSYIVASAVKCEKYFPGQSGEGPAFRMHAVILKKHPDPEDPSNINWSVNGRGKWTSAINMSPYILCHVRRVSHLVLISLG